MPFDRFLIAPINSGLRTDLRPWLIPEDAWTTMQNAYVFRGRIRKRFGSKYMGNGGSSPLAQLMSRLRINVGVLGGGSALAGTAPGIIWKVGQIFSVGNTLYTVIATGLAAMLSTVPGDTGTFDTTTGAFTINSPSNPPGTIVYFYPAEPVMGLTNYALSTINDQPAYAFDTQFVYVWTTATAWQLSGTYNSGTGVLTSAIWHDPSGNKLNYVLAENWQGNTANIDELFVTNFQVTNMNGLGVVTDDPLWSFDGTTWTIFKPYFLPSGGAVAAGPFVQTARIIVAFHNRLLLLNTVENDNSGGFGVNTWYPNRVRFSWRGTPLATQAWYEPNQQDAAGNVAGGAGFVDASTDEQIISAEFIKDRLIVYFERSTWELAYTGNELQPFVWQKINTELGSESTFSSVPFDKVILTIGNTGVHACSGANVERIDQNIPDEIFRLQNKNSEPARIHGIRDYFTELVYWCFAPNSENPNLTYPDKVLVYNYRNGAWAFNDDCITAFGYFEQQEDETWATSQYAWNATNNTWLDGIEDAQFRQIIAGNQEGYVFIVDPELNENASVMQLTNFATAPGLGPNQIALTIIDHTLAVGDYIHIEFIVGTLGALLNNKIFQVISLGQSPFYSASDVVYIQLTTSAVGLTYLGGGVITRVSNIGLKSKQWNPYVGQGQDFYLGRIDFAVAKAGDFSATNTGPQITVDYSPSDTNISLVEDGIATGAIMGNNILDLTPYDPALYPLESKQNRLWHPIYFQSWGECIQISMYYSPNQITNPDIAFSQFEMEGLVLHTQPQSSRLE